MVEEIHEATDRMLPVADAISHLKRATLPALLEYGCLRWATNGQLPMLPEAVVESPLGQALSRVRCELGLRATGPPKPQLRRIDTQLAEFHVIAGRGDLQDDEWQHFGIRFDRSAQSVGFPVKTAHALQAALQEMADNAVIHAEAPTAVLVGYQVIDGAALFSVADVGIGVLASLRSHPAYQHLQVHNDAIRAALRDGTSRFGPNTRGMGFRQVFKALAAQWGYLRFRSGKGCVTLNGEGLDADQGKCDFPPQLPGFQLTVCCRTSAAAPVQALV
jgi:anti-sigma regulatory factor (Ser/Thr protein kinase)